MRKKLTYMTETALWKYLKQNKIKQFQLAEIVGCSKGHMSKIVKGEHRCSPELAKKIEEATEGYVSAIKLVFLEKTKI